MIRHNELGSSAFSRFRALRLLIANGEVTLGGYTKGKIYGSLSCGSGKRIKPANRVFFANEQEALGAGYRPCGNCMPQAYKLWKLKKWSYLKPKQIITYCHMMAR